MQSFDFVPVAAIAVICYFFGMFIKITNIDSKWIPIIAGFLGGILGYIGMLTIPDYPFQDPLNAIALGIISGGGATWINQIGKQLGIGHHSN